MRVSHSNECLVPLLEDIEASEPGSDQNHVPLDQQGTPVIRVRRSSDAGTVALNSNSVANAVVER